MYEVCPKNSWTSSKTLKGGPVDLKSSQICKGNIFWINTENLMKIARLVYELYTHLP